jgi:DNA polymerase
VIVKPALALPATLEKVALSLGLEQQKDRAGHDNMLRMSRPRKPTKKEDPKGLYWNDDQERREWLYSYCKQDVETERAVHARVGHLSPEEQAVWILDATINDRGIYIDRELAEASIRIAGLAHEEINAELRTLTEGAATSLNQTAKLIDWLAAHGCEVANVQKETLRRALTLKDLPQGARRVMELRLDGAHAAADKFKTMMAWRNPDGRIRGAFKYHGASTGRWSSHGVQLQNMKRPLVEDMGAAIEAVATGDFAHLRSLYPRPMSVIGDIARGTICARPGCRLVAADFSGVESRITAWLSGQQSKLDQWAKFDSTKDPADEPYSIVGHSCGLPPELARNKGKTADLAFGYGGGEGAYRKLAPDDPSNSAEIKQYQQVWQRAHPATVRFWGDINRAAIKAVQSRGKVFNANERISFKCDGDFLRMRLPSKRELAYPFPRLTTNERCDCVVSFKDIQQGQWADCRHGLGAWHGTWIENAVQAVARDLFAAAMPRLEANGYPIVLHVHDEIVGEVPLGFGSADEFLQIITKFPDWAEGMPVSAKIWESTRFCKLAKPKPDEAEMHTKLATAQNDFQEDSAPGRYDDLSALEQFRTAIERAGLIPLVTSKPMASASLLERRQARQRCRLVCTPHKQRFGRSVWMFQRPEIKISPHLSSAAFKALGKTHYLNQ